ncbi:hypothetical protein KUH03_27050 [Sphingobacterium sp. E70]|uniref:hypothetical protein n=1 Tax=Sphingobacterium sp. E70 TaxID=2853439 RepID=UPI00211CD969|nr:hypothetical protein [Sphingobacterium sp. E70]ULT22914.1 hypothetical protein KUH03_27050 [Sphingobacterium sp. E70]
MQVFLFQNIGYYNLVAAFPYVLFIFLLPTGTPNFLVYLIAFLTGLTVDSFYDTLGSTPPHAWLWLHSEFSL